MHILYVHDAASDAYLVKALRELGHVVDMAGGEADGLVQAGLEAYDVVAADFRRGAGENVGAYARALRDSGARSLLVTVLAAQAPAAERAQVLRAGADLCFTRPFEIRELDARLRALAALGERARIDPLARSRLELLRDARTLRLGRREIELSQREFQLLAYLAQRPGQVIKPDELQRHVWGAEADAPAQTVARAMRRLRRRLLDTLGESPIEVVRGHGYAFQRTGSDA